MNIVKKDGVQCIVLEKGEKIYVTTPNRLEEDKIEIKGGGVVAPFFMEYTEQTK